VFENMMLRRIFGLKRDGVTGGLRKLHNNELWNLYILYNWNDQVVEDKMGMACGKNEKVY
jgi:hypothetical protein